MIVCVSVVGHQNNPLYLQSFSEADDALKLHHIVHCSLDVVDERVNNPKKSGSTLNETFLGSLYPTENYKVYGYLTNTKVKFIMVTTDLDVRDADVRSDGFSEERCYLKIQQDTMAAWHASTITRAFFDEPWPMHATPALCPTLCPAFFRRFHSAYVDAVSNPFHVPGKKITSRTFAERVSGIVKTFGSTA